MAWSARELFEVVQDGQIGGVEDGAAERQPEIDAHREDAHPDGHDRHGLSRPEAILSCLEGVIPECAML